MTTKRVLFIFAIITLIISLPFTFIHITAVPDDAPISPLQHTVAAIANLFGPWGVAIVRVVDFPNAGMRSFNWILALCLTTIAVLLIFAATRVAVRKGQICLTILWGILMIVWFGVGLTQIADGLL